MKKFVVAAVACLVLAFGTVVAADSAQAESVKSLRGDVAIDAGNQAPEGFKQLTPESFKRSYKQQPPLVPHKVDKYQINLKANQCLKCHDKSTYKDEDAPMIGKTHYVDKDGKESENIYMGRYFCNQCHVPQLDAKPLVENTFKGE